jgi:hypothetical protein
MLAVKKNRIEELKEKHLGWLPIDLAVVFSNTKISF